jgi:hydroxyacylglutathione hydrolase
VPLSSRSALACLALTGCTAAAANARPAPPAVFGSSDTPARPAAEQAHLEIADGSLPETWDHGADCDSEPELQIHAYNEDFYVLRQSICTSFEAPFIYLIFGDDAVLMQDTGAGGVEIRAAIDEIIDQWLTAHHREKITLLVTHSHAHGDHVAGDSQFVARPDTVLVGARVEDVRHFFGIEDWPSQQAELDLGGRVIDVIPLPGHQASHVALYDRRTKLLLTGDSLYPGRLYFRENNFSTYRDSIRRLARFVADHEIRHVLGTHIEMTEEAGLDFPMGAKTHPNERPLQLAPHHITDLANALESMGGEPRVEKHDHFVIHPVVAPEK